MVEESHKTRLGSENDEEGEEEEMEECRKKWLKHYSPHHQILLVGEGDFSFSSSLASAFGSASNVTATSLDPYDALIRKYKEAKSNLGKLKKQGASLLHGVDATLMKFHAYLRMRKFDRIIFNFPHAGFHGKEDDVQMIHKMLRADGEVHVRHKTTAPFCLWKLEELASWASLKLIDETAFKSKNYPGYHNKRGDGRRCDEPFPLGTCSTFKFRFYPGAGELLGQLMVHNNGIHGVYRQIYESPVQMPVEFPPIYERSVQVHVGFEKIYENLALPQKQSPLLSFGPFPSMNHVPLPRNAHFQLVMNSRNEYGGISACHRNIMQDIPQRTCYDDAKFCPVPPLRHYGDGDLLGQLMAHNNGIHGEYRQIYKSPVQMPIEFPPIYERSVQVHVGSERIYENLALPQLPPLSFGPFPSMIHVPLPRNAHFQFGMNSRNEYGGMNACHRNVM